LKTKVELFLELEDGTEIVEPVILPDAEKQKIDYINHLKSEIKTLFVLHKGKAIPTEANTPKTYRTIGNNHPVSGFFTRIEHESDFTLGYTLYRKFQKSDLSPMNRKALKMALEKDPGCEAIQ